MTITETGRMIDERPRFCEKHAEDPWDAQSFGVLPWGGGTPETCPDCKRYGTQ